MIWVKNNRCIVQLSPYNQVSIMYSSSTQNVCVWYLEKGKLIYIKTRADTIVTTEIILLTMLYMNLRLSIYSCWLFLSMILTQESCSQYWPTEKDCPEMYGKLNVSLVSEKTNEGYTTRTLELTENVLIHTHSQMKKSKVVQFHIQNWPPKTSSVTLDLIEKVNRMQIGQGRVPIIVVCE